MKIVLDMIKKQTNEWMDTIKQRQEKSQWAIISS